MGFVENLKKNWFLQALWKNKAVKKAYLFVVYFLFRKPFGNEKLLITTDNHMQFYVDYTFGRHKYEGFGDRHNAGFQNWLESCKGKKTVLDVGAHIGLYSIPASPLVDPQGKIYAFEPSQANGRYLQKHMNYNHCRNIEILPYLVGEKNSDNIAFYEHPDADPMNALIIQKGPENYKKVAKKQITLDEFCRSRQITPEVVKIDVEGAEVKVFQGARVILARSQPDPIGE